MLDGQDIKNIYYLSSLIAFARAAAKPCKRTDAQILLCLARAAQKDRTLARFVGNDLARQFVFQRIAGRIDLPIHGLGPNRMLAYRKGRGRRIDKTLMMVMRDAADLNVQNRRIRKRQTLEPLFHRMHELLLRVFTQSVSDFYILLPYGNAHRFIGKTKNIKRMFLFVFGYSLTYLYYPTIHILGKEKLLPSIFTGGSSVDAMKDLFIIAVNGGGRGGKTSQMLHEISEGCHTLRDHHPEWRAGIAVNFMRLWRAECEISFLIDPETQKPEGNVQFLLEMIKKADGLILATPVRWGNMSALMLRFLEWLYFLEEEAGWPLRGMPVAYAAHGQIDGGQAAINAMQTAMMHLKCITPEDGHFYRIESLMPHAPSDRELRWMTTDAQLVGLRVAEAAFKRKYDV